MFKILTGEQKTRRRRKKVKEDELSAEMKKRRLNDEQVKFLEMSFKKERKLETGRKVGLATELGLDPKQVAVWFQNRRARHKSKQLEEEYMKLKSAHDSVVVEKCHLENEVLLFSFLFYISLYIIVIHTQQQLKSFLLEFRYMTIYIYMKKMLHLQMVWLGNKHEYELIVVH